MEVARCSTACRWCNRTGNPTMSTTAKVSFGTVPQANQPTAAPKPDAPFRIAVLADFSGRQGRGEIGSPDEIAGRRLLRISRDSFDDVMSKLGAQLEVPVGDDSATAALGFGSLDD